MKKSVIIVMLLLLSSVTFAQNSEGAEAKIGQGVTLHDKGDFLGAISKYNEALELDKDNLVAYIEKAFTLISLERYDDAISVCKTAIEKHPGDKNLKSLYVTYGSAYDYLKKPEQSIAVYNEGIKLFPDFYLLYFNKGVSLAGQEKMDEAIAEFQKAVKINPKHASSHHAIATLLKYQHKKIPSIMAYSRFLVLEPTGQRASENLESMKEQVVGNVHKTGKNTITINMDPASVSDTTEDGNPNDNNFSTVELLMSLSSALDSDKKNSDKSEVERFIEKAEMMFATLDNSKNEHNGFYWNYYAPYFSEMHKKKLVEAFAYIVFASSEDKDISKWIKKHPKDIEAYYQWSESFKWFNN
jgi:tetratricopeptide (TPR) repeat protein